MKIKIADFTKYYGKLKICESCNWDIADIKLLYIRECEIKNPNQLSNIVKEYKIFIRNYSGERFSNRILEFQRKLRTNSYDD